MTTVQKRRHAERLVAAAQRAMFLDAYDLTVVVATKPHEGDNEHNERVAECSPNFPYLDARLTVYPCFWGRTSAGQWHAVRHELAHLITEPMRAIARRLVNDKFVTAHEISETDERITDHIARIAGGRP